MLSLPKDLDSVDYSFQSAYVTGMMGLISRLLQAGSQVDEEIKKEVNALPDGFIFKMEVMPELASFTMQKRANSLQILTNDPSVKSDLTIKFKHISHAFLVFSFQEGTAVSFANDRLLLDGNTALAMKMVRCLNRVESVVLPKIVAEKAVKTYPELTLVDKLQLSTKTYGKLITNLVKEI